jgi:hypothetical protein
MFFSIRNFLIVGLLVDCGFFDDCEIALHAGFVVTWDEAREFEGPAIGEFPKDLSSFAWLQSHSIRIVVFHIWELLHHGLVLHYALVVIENEFVYELTHILHREEYRLTFHNIDTFGFKNHVSVVNFLHSDGYGSTDSLFLARFAYSHISMVVIATIGMVVIATIGMVIIFFCTVTMGFFLFNFVVATGVIATGIRRACHHKGARS